MSVLPLTGEKLRMARAGKISVVWLSAASPSAPGTAVRETNREQQTQLLRQ
jgi:hypothetical protein